MTTIKEIRETTYEPTVSDKVNRILYRLENGEKLCDGTLKENANFCILGLFADESGLGKWRPFGSGDFGAYAIDGDNNYGEIFVLPDAVVDYYSLVNNSATFNVNDLPDPDLIEKLVQDDLTYYDGTTSLARINDCMVRRGKSEEVNEILTKIIKSGVIFK